MKLIKGVASEGYLDIYSDNYEEQLWKMKLHGFDGMDFSEFVDTEKPLFKMSESDFEKTLMKVKNAAKTVGIQVFQCHGPWRYPPRDFEELDRQNRFYMMSKAIRGAAILGCPYIVIHPLMPFGVKAVPETEPEKMREINLEYYTRLSAVAKEYGVTLCLENMPFTEFSLSTPAQILSLVKEIDSPNMRICLDTGHAVIFGDPADAVRLIGKEYLATLHLHDNSGKRDEHKFPYNGKIDWERLCEAIREIGFGGMINFETWVKGKYPPAIKEHFDIGFAMLTDHVLSMINR